MHQGDVHQSSYISIVDSQEKLETTQISLNKSILVIYCCIVNYHDLVT